ncbi:UspA domain-containing protein (plasmid) [Gemmatirosa kalamazoonensis]|uniref:UspA domain-containing protein n=1 Tax=Gemmatirosa kalamazoonensis TaxID=861299 RepID=W0RQ46_9BACT|nr:universal stress protein [Gemmatirosa kalamazoonensis]AHG92602.1 UspA domain-containing protein [Gemmatirosa kalamazoonensis]
MSSTVPADRSSPAEPRATGRALRGPVVLACDGRAPNDAAALAARAAAERLGAPLEVVAALRPLPVPVGPDFAPIPPEVDAARRGALREAVVARLEPVLGSQARWRITVRDGAPGGVIADVARERRAALIVLGTGAHGVANRLLGEEISLQAVRHSGVPVLALAHDAAGPMRRAVAAIDFSASSVHAARTALALLDPGSHGGAVLTLVHVRSPRERSPLLPPWESAHDAFVGALFTRLCDMLRPHVPDGVTVETYVATGGVVECIDSVATYLGADLVAVGTHGPGWVERLFVGSVATDALRRLDTSVLVTPPPAAAERVRLELQLHGRVAMERHDDWRHALDVLSHRNLRRRVRLEVVDEHGNEYHVDAYRFHGATYDPHDRRVGIMLGDADDRAHHLTHAITGVRSVEIVGEDDRRDHALLVASGRGEATLTFLD